MPWLRNEYWDEPQETHSDEATMKVWPRYDEDLKLNAKFEVCPTCHGQGKHSLRLGVITQEQIDRDWDPDDFQDYLDGAYDQACETCKGKRVVLVPDPDRNSQEDMKAWEQALKDIREMYAEQWAEIRAGA